MAKTSAEEQARAANGKSNGASNGNGESKSNQVQVDGHAAIPTRPLPTSRGGASSRVRIALTVFALCLLVFYQRNQKKTGGTALPETYAICSREGEARVYTAEINETSGEGGVVQCVVVRGKRVADLGSLEHIRSTWGEKDRTGPTVRSPWDVRKTGVDIFYLEKGEALTPGLVDSHAHTLQYGQSQQLPLLGSSSIQEVITRTEAYVEAHRAQVDAGAWVEGMGWDQNIWEVKEWPKAADLEASPILRGLPISLKRIDIHAEWVSPAVLDLMAPIPETVEGGEILRDAAGRPTGIFTDDAMFLIDAVRPKRTHAQMVDDLKMAVQDGVAKGLVGIHDAGVGRETVDFFERMGEEGKLPIRFYLMLACPIKEKYCGDDFDMIHNAADGRLNMRSVKLFADGALGSWGAAMLEPYSDKPDTSGTMRSPDEIWTPLIGDFIKNGWQVNVHTIGDKANHLALNAMEAAFGSAAAAATNGSSHRSRLEHAQILKLDDLKRAAEMGVIASYQPTHATSDMWYAEQRLGPERIKGAYAWRRYLEHGGRITLGSDFPVESIDPLKGFYSAVTRRDESGKSPMGPDGWFPDQKLSRDEALRGMTIDAAYSSFQEEQLGSFTPGKRFDAVIWSQDLMTVPADEILQSKVKATLVDGRCVFGAVSGRS